MPPPPPDARVPPRALAGGVATLGAAGCWFAQAFLPWTGRGPLSHASGLDVVRLTRQGAIDAFVDGWVVTALLVLPALALVLLALAPWAGRVVLILRAVLLALGGLLAAAALVAVGGGSGGWGPGAVVTASAVPCVVAALALGRLPRPARSRPHPSPAVPTDPPREVHP